MSSLLDNMVEILAPEIGAITARESILMYAQRMGLTEDTLGPEHVKDVVEKLKPGLRVFVGSKKTEHLCRLMEVFGEVGG